jgi:pyruvate-ferredoxin/flavodoxin oxidoreductase
LSIFGDHSDVMAARPTGFAILGSSSVQEAQDMALVAHLATMQSRIPFLHFFDGFRTSHEVSKIDLIDEAVIRRLIDEDHIAQHRLRSLNPNRPVLRGSAQNPDVFFQAREAANGFYDVMPEVVKTTMKRIGEETGRFYDLFGYTGSPEAETVMVIMGSGVGAAREAVNHLVERGEKVGLVQVRLYRPFSGPDFVRSIPSSARRVVVMDRTKEPGAVGEPLYQDVLSALAEQGRDLETFGGRYGLSSKEFSPDMVAGVFNEVTGDTPRRHFTVGIRDDVTGLSIDYDSHWWSEPEYVSRAVFYGLGSDGTVGANKNSVKIIGESTDLHAQGYFVYDSKKSGSQTISHLRISPHPIESSYLIKKADFVGVHQFDFLHAVDVLDIAAPNAKVLLNSPYPPETVWERLPREAQTHILDKNLELWAIDAADIAGEAGLGGRINTVLQTCFFHLTDFLATDEALAAIKEQIRKAYGKRGEVVVRRNEQAVDSAVAGLYRVEPGAVASVTGISDLVPDGAPDFVKRVTAMIMAGMGDMLPVSALPVDGTFPTGTAKVEKRSIAHEIPIWDPETCIECGLCALVCPHAAIRSKAFPQAALAGAPERFASIPWKGKELPDHRMTIQVAPDDCTGCGVCVDVCPAKSKEVVKHKAINMSPKEEHLKRERANFEFFLRIPELDRAGLKVETVKGSQLLEPLFEFSGACAGCGETPYLKLMSQLFGDRALIANATGCSSIYGGNLPTTPWSVNAEGRGPSWNNSLFEDNAEFGLGLRLAVDARRDYAEHLARQLAPQLGGDLVEAVLHARQSTEAEIRQQRERLAEIRRRLANIGGEQAARLLPLVNMLEHHSVWIVGGDGWAYDIGFGGLDHVLSSGRNVNILVLDTGVYSNTGGQMSKATPRAAIAKFAAGGKPSRKKDLGMIAVAYGNVYVAQVAMGSNPAQTIRAFLEAESYPGPSLLLAYSHCIAHGINMATSMTHQKDVVQSGLWPLYRYDPRLAHKGEHPFHLDSHKPTLPFEKFAQQEARFAMLARSDPEHARRLFELAQNDIDDRWHYYEQMAGVEREIPEELAEATQ